jgi:hypothetical protein
MAPTQSIIPVAVIRLNSVLLPEISWNFVDRVLRIPSHTIHEITLSYLKEHEIRVFVQSLGAETSLVKEGTESRAQLGNS